jgi:hypothetical protein
MTSYIANHQKKLRALARRELDLLRALQRGERESKVLEAAEGVRAARVRVLFVQHSLIAPCEKNASRLRRKEEEIQSSQATPISDIVAEFKARLTQSVGTKRNRSSQEGRHASR